MEHHFFQDSQTKCFLTYYACSAWLFMGQTFEVLSVKKKSAVDSISIIHKITVSIELGITLNVHNLYHMQESPFLSILASSKFVQFWERGKVY